MRLNEGSDVETADIEIMSIDSWESIRGERELIGILEGVPTSAIAPEDDR
jgi:hypothetical protein